MQGVGYRWFVRETAGRFGVAGWARNRSNGDVEIEAQGEKEALAQLASFLKKGHPYARVDGIDETEIAVVKKDAVFEIRHG